MMTRLSPATPMKHTPIDTVLLPQFKPLPLRNGPLFCQSVVFAPQMMLPTNGQDRLPRKDIESRDRRALEFTGNLGTDFTGVHLDRGHQAHGIAA
jgi:hypothetical protein